MKVAYIFNDSFYDQFLTVTNSILKNEKKELANSIEFYIAFFGKEESVEPLLKLSSTYFPNNKFYIKHVPTEFADLCAKYESSYDKKKATVKDSSVLARFDLDIFWPEVTDRILYLDLDLIVRGSLSELFDSSDKDSLMSACWSNEILASELESWSTLGNIPKAQKKYYDYLREFRDNLEKIYNNQLVHSPDKSLNADSYEELSTKEYNLLSPALNAGVFILNMEKYRKDSSLRRNIEFLKALNRFGMLFKYNDQSIFNICFYDQIDWIDPRWNRLHYGWYKPGHFEKGKADFIDAKIVHYNGEYKPWLFKDSDEFGLIDDVDPAVLRHFRFMSKWDDSDEYFKPGRKLWKEHELCEK